MFIAVKVSMLLLKMYKKIYALYMHYMQYMHTGQAITKFYATKKSKTFNISLVSGPLH